MIKMNLFNISSFKIHINPCFEMDLAQLRGTGMDEGITIPSLSHRKVVMMSGLKQSSEFYKPLIQNIFFHEITVF